MEIGDWIDNARTREVEGHITIDRQRYLHVNVHLNHWQLAEDAQALPEDETTELSQETPPPAGATGAEDTAPSSTTLDESAAQPLAVMAEPARWSY